jgi:hypothetical protein
VAEPFINQTLRVEEMPELAMKTRLERRAEVASARFVAEFDYSVYYDQFSIPHHLRSCYVFKVRTRDGYKLYAFCKMLMGVRFAVGVAQTVTWVIVFTIARWCSTMIDNVRIAANTPSEFLHAVKTFLRRSDEVGATLNDRDTWNISDQEILQRGHQSVIGPFIFLGEEYANHFVRSAPKHIEKLQRAHGLLLQSPVTTRRRFAAIASLITWMCNTINVGHWNLFSLRRAHSRLVSPSATVYNDVQWDEPITLAPTVLADISQAVGLLVANRPAPLRPLLPPGRSNADYDIVAHVDAAGNGWAGFVWFKATGEIYIVKAGFYNIMQHSAHGEPKGAKLVLRWARAFAAQKGWPADNIATISDHDALATGQRQWFSGYKGFSAAYPLNEFYVELYRDDDLLAVRRDVFHVDGVNNIADAESRSVHIRQPLEVRRADVFFPDVSNFAHPYLHPPPRSAWQV